MPFRLLKAKEAETIEALGETLVPGARQAGVAHFVDQQVSVTPAKRCWKPASSTSNRLRQFLSRRDRRGRQGERSPARTRLRGARPRTSTNSSTDAQNKIEGWQGPAGSFAYLVLRSDAVDVVYGTMEGYERLGVPYMPHIRPKRW